MLAPEMWLMRSDERRARGKLWFKSCGAQALKVRARLKRSRLLYASGARGRHRWYAGIAGYNQLVCMASA